MAACICAVLCERHRFGREDQAGHRHAPPTEEDVREGQVPSCRVETAGLVDRGCTTWAHCRGIWYGRSMPYRTLGLLGLLGHAHVYLPHKDLAKAGLGFGNS